MVFLGRGARQSGNMSHNVMLQDHRASIQRHNCHGQLIGEECVCVYVYVCVRDILAFSNASQCMLHREMRLPQ